MSGHLQGCGKDEGPLTLYRLSDGAPPTPLNGDYWQMACGYRPETKNSAARGILLCGSCAERLKLPQLK